LAARIARCDWRARIGIGISIWLMRTVRKNILLAGYAALQHIALGNLGHAFTSPRRTEFTWM